MMSNTTYEEPQWVEYFLKIKTTHRPQRTNGHQQGLGLKAVLDKVKKFISTQKCQKLIALRVVPFVNMTYLRILPSANSQYNKNLCKKIF